MIYDEQLHELGDMSIKLHTKIFSPNPALINEVSNYFIHTREFSHPANNHWYILPDNCAYLIFYLFDYGNTVVPKWKIVGPRSRHKMINRINRHLTFICAFKAGGLSTFLDVPVYELRDQVVDASCLSNYSVKTFEQLTECALCGNTAEMVKKMDDFLINTKTTPKYAHRVLERFTQLYLKNSMRSSLVEVSKELGYSDRQLRNLIQHYVGHSPKMMNQINRFTTSLTLCKTGLNWAEISCESGYYDQSHMIADYHKLVGTSPEKLFS